jgi:putative ABC transport system ATP-binding protein
MNEVMGGVVRAPALELLQVRRRYPGHPPVDALREVSLRMGRGELTAVVGPSGSGKSTLLHVMGTLDRPSAGRVVVDGIDTTRLTDRRLAGLRARRIGFVFQQFFLLPGVSAMDNVADGLLYSGVPHRQRRDRAADALRRVGLGHRLHHRPDQLSGGERQRAAIARAIVHRPAFVLADEPTGNLDSRSGASIVELLTELNEGGTTIVIITHEEVVASACPRQVRLLDGLVQQDTAGVAA